MATTFSVCTACWRHVRQHFVGVQAHQELEQRLVGQGPRRSTRRSNRLCRHCHEGAARGRAIFRQHRGVWVCSWSTVKALATVLRFGLLEVGKARVAMQDQHDKTELVYNYLTGTEFQQRVTGVVEAMVSMQLDLDSEKRSTKRLWSKREKQIVVLLAIWQASTATCRVHRKLAANHRRARCAETRMRRAAIAEVVFRPVDHEPGAQFFDLRLITRCTAGLLAKEPRR